MGLANIAELERKVASQLALANLGLSPLPMLHQRYRIEEIRGRGARGLVVRAVDTAIGRMVALKLYPPLDDTRLDREVVREAQALGRLEHPNVVRIYDVGQAELALETESMTTRFMCIEYIEGTSLRSWAMQKKRRRSQIVRALLAAAEGLSAAHAAGIVHRDVKPDNIMVERSGVIKVVDFGLARGLHTMGPDQYVPGNAANAWSTVAGGAIGTPEYMAPEARHGQAFAEADQYSFAMSAWELLAGLLPYDSSTESYKPPEQETFSGGQRIPRALRVALERALDFNPSGRHRDMRALIRAIRRGRTVRRIGVGAGAAAVSTLAVGLAFISGQGVDELPRSETVSAAAMAKPATPKASVDEATCLDLAGRWYFNTAVTWANNVQFRGINGYYELELRPEGACEFSATIRKTGSTKHQNSSDEIREGRSRVEAKLVDGRPSVTAELPLTSRKYETSEYRLSFVFEKDGTMAGAYWHRPQGQVAHYIAGVLEGGRHKPDRELTEHEVELPCASQCVPSCPDRTSREACEARCAAGGPAMPCGAPSDPRSVPKSARGGIDDTAPRHGTMNRWAQRRCERTAQDLRGAWTLFVLGEEPVEFEVSASGCSLTFSDGLDGTGDVDGRGVWRRTTSKSVGFSGATVLEPQLALTGWGPAFGVTHDGKPAAAYRKR